MQIVNSTFACTTVPAVKLALGSLPDVKMYTKFPGGKVRFTDFTAMMFRSGKINVLGVKDVSELTRILDVLTDYLNNAGYAVTVTGALTNVVVSFKCDDGIDLPGTYSLLSTAGYKCMLELELYPALRVWNNWTALIYHTGVVIITGLSSANAAEEAVESLMMIVHKCQ